MVFRKQLKFDRGQLRYFHEFRHLNNKKNTEISLIVCRPIYFNILSMLFIVLCVLQISLLQRVLERRGTE